MTISNYDTFKFLLNDFKANCHFFKFIAYDSQQRIYFMPKINDENKLKILQEKLKNVGLNLMTAKNIFQFNQEPKVEYYVIAEEEKPISEIELWILIKDGLINVVHSDGAFYEIPY